MKFDPPWMRDKEIDFPKNDFKMFFTCVHKCKIDLFWFWVYGGNWSENLHNMNTMSEFMKRYVLFLTYVTVFPDYIGIPRKMWDNEYIFKE